MTQYNIHSAKTNLSALVEKAAIGEIFAIAKAGKPMVKVIPYASQAENHQRIGFLEGQFEIPDDFDTMGQEEIIKMFEGSE
ncbi:MAG: hypothetical protein FWD47_12580 [Treponema sp.]|nr:hypothetical protein [Treponema sp.]